MSKELDLHTFARRYCIERIAYWQEKYDPIFEAALSNMGSKDFEYSDNAYEIFPRYNVLDAILLEIETLDPHGLPHLDKLAKVLCDIGHRANSDFTGDHENPIGWSAEHDERQSFDEAIEKAAAGGLTDQEPLFYRRVLQEEEVSDLWRKASEKWGATGDYWYPLGDRTHPSLIALRLADVNAERLHQTLKKFISYPGAERIYELREYGPANYLLDAEAAELFYNGVEGYWFSQTNDWIVYCSHEGTITLGGTIASVAEKYTQRFNRLTARQITRL